jgi:hypothetical protein
VWYDTAWQRLDWIRGGRGYGWNSYYDHHWDRGWRYGGGDGMLRARERDDRNNNSAPNTYPPLFGGQKPSPGATPLPPQSPPPPPASAGGNRYTPPPASSPPPPELIAIGQSSLNKLGQKSSASTGWRMGCALTQPSPNLTS